MIRFRARRWQHEELALRLCQLIYGTDRIWRKESGAWQIGSANDWWLHPKEDGSFLLHYRYGNKQRMQQMAPVLTWFLDVEIIEVT